MFELTILFSFITATIFVDNIIIKYFCEQEVISESLEI